MITRWLDTRAWVWLVATASLLPFSGRVHAELIEFIHSGSGSGTLNGVAFGMSDFTIRAFGDTSDRQIYLGDYWIEHSSASIEISGLGVMQFIAPTTTVVGNSVGTVGFAHSLHSSSSGLTLILGPTDPAFQTWDMLGGIGPIAGSTRLLQWTDTYVQTDRGRLVFASQSNVAGTFQAIVPAPGLTSVLWCTGALAARRRR